MGRRIERVNSLLRAEISRLVQREIRDPRLGSLVSITEVETSRDLESATVFVSVLGTEDDQKAALSVLRHATGYIRHELAESLRLRHLPELNFRLDTSIEQGARVMELLRELNLEGDGGTKQ